MSTEEAGTVHYTHPTGGWGSMRGMVETALQERIRPSVARELLRQNKPDGFACVSCAWAKPANYATFEFCENGAKATMWELTSRRCTPAFFAEHTVTELKGWTDHALEQTGRLTHPMRYDRASDKYVPCGWDEAFAAIGAELRALNPKDTVFYASGRASLETSYLWALFARAYGHNNLPDSSNMCHETTSVALKKVIGSPVGTCVLEDFHQCEAIFFFGQNSGSNSPRFLHPLQEAVKRGVKIVTFNPVRERGLIEFRNPQSPAEMLGLRPDTDISCQYHQVKAGGDIAVLIGMAKHVLALEDRKWAEERLHVLDPDFLAQHTHGFDAWAEKVRATPWEEIEQESGLRREKIEEAAQVYADSHKTIAIWGMGLTQHVHGSDNLFQLTNLMLLKGNIGRDGTGMSPVRGHSNVQGQRTVGISEKPELVPMDKIAELFGFAPPMDEGMNTVKACGGIIDGSVKAFFGLGGNFLRAVPEQGKMEAAWEKMRLTVQIATKLNRNHLFNGEVAYLLPCLGRIERDMQASGEQVVSMEDSMSCVHGSRGKHKPAGKHLLSETAIVCRLAEATLAPNPKLKWREWTGDYKLVRTLIEQTYPEQFYDFEARLFTPGGFYRGNAARDRVWKTETGKAQFTPPTRLSATGVPDAPGRYRLITMRSNDQFNTTIYGYSDRLRGIEGTRTVLLMNPEEIAKAGLEAGDVVALDGDAGDGEQRSVGGLTVTPFSLPDGVVGGYYPELNYLIPLWYHDQESGTPASKAVPVKIRIERRKREEA